jgi:hypothetical protein
MRSYLPRLWYSSSVSNSISQFSGDSFSRQLSALKSYISLMFLLNIFFDSTICYPFFASSDSNKTDFIDALWNGPFFLLSS